MSHDDIAEVVCVYEPETSTWADARPPNRLLAIIKVKHDSAPIPGSNWSLTWSHSSVHFIDERHPFLICILYTYIISRLLGRLNDTCLASSTRISLFIHIRLFLLFLTWAFLEISSIWLKCMSNIRWKKMAVYIPISNYNVGPQPLLRCWLQVL